MIKSQFELLTQFDYKLLGRSERMLSKDKLNWSFLKFQQTKNPIITPVGSSWLPWILNTGIEMLRLLSS